MRTAMNIFSSPRVASFRSVPRSRFMSEAVAGMTHYANTLTIQWAGEPSESLIESQTPLSEPQDNEVQIQMLAAPINPSDINTVQGTYPLKPGLPGVGGHEGVGRVNTVGPSCKRFKVGDLVVPLASAQGTWRDRGNFNEEHWHKVPSELPLVDAATLTINPGTALCMLEHFVDLKDGDCVVQSGANSAVGQYVIQICKMKGVKTINIVRDRPDRKWDDVVASLKDKGADLVATPENVREEAKNSGLPKPKLALNCVGGEVATTMAKMLDRSGTIVTYGGMARQPVTIPIPLLIFNDIRCLGFWISGHMSQLMGLEGKAQLYDRLAKMVLDGHISAPPARLVPFADWKEAFKAAQGEGKKEKIILRMRDDQDNSEVNVTPPEPEARRW